MMSSQERNWGSGPALPLARWVILYKPRVDSLSIVSMGP